MLVLVQHLHSVLLLLHLALVLVFVLVLVLPKLPISCHDSSVCPGPVLSPTRCPVPAPRPCLGLFPNLPLIFPTHLVLVLLHLLLHFRISWIPEMDQISQRPKTSSNLVELTPNMEEIIKRIMVILLLLMMLEMLAKLVLLVLVVSWFCCFK